MEPDEDHLCIGCSQKNEVVGDTPGSLAYTVTEKELTALRIEYIKNQILKKLRLKEKPQVSMADLPKPVIEDQGLIPNQDDYWQNSYLNDFFAKTTFSIIFPYEGKANMASGSDTPLKLWPKHPQKYTLQTTCPKVSQ